MENKLIKLMARIEATIYQSLKIADVQQSANRRCPLNAYTAFAQSVILQQPLKLQNR